MNKILTLAVTAAMLAGSPTLAADSHKGHGMKMDMSADSMHKTHSGKFMIKEPWARASIGRNGAAYFTLVNTGDTDLKVVGIMAGVAKRAELHTHIMDGDIMRMRPVDHIMVPAGESVTLKPGGDHVMLMGLTGKLKEGDTFPLTVMVENAGKMEVSVKVGKMGASGPMGSMGGMNHMQGHGDQKMDSMGGHGGHNMKH